MTALRVVAWNLAEGTNNRREDQISCLQRIVDRLIALDADVLLINEICRWNAITYGGVDQIEWLRSRLPYPYIAFERTATIAFQGEKLVCVFSKTPLFDQQRIEHSAYPDGGGYATLLVRTSANGRTHHIFSTRMTAWDVAENIRSHEMLLEIVTKIPDSDNIILGGDFNSGAGGVTNWPPDQPRTIPLEMYMVVCRVRHVLGMLSHNGTVDHIFVRGNYNIAASGFDSPTPNPSDHLYIFADLVPAENGARIVDFEMNNQGTVESPLPFRAVLENTGQIAWERSQLYRISLSPPDLLRSSSFTFADQVPPGSRLVFEASMRFRSIGNHLVRMQMRQIGAFDFGDAMEIRADILSPRQMLVSIEPAQIVLNRTTTFTVIARDSTSGSSISGMVYIDSSRVGSTNSPITYTFRRRRVDGVWEYPSGYIVSDGYDPVDLQFGFP